MGYVTKWLAVVAASAMLPFAEIPGFVKAGDLGHQIDFYEQSLAIARESSGRRRKGIALGNIYWILQLLVFWKS